MSDYAASVHLSHVEETAKVEMNDYSDEETRSFVYEEKNAADDENYLTSEEEEEEEEEGEEEEEEEEEEYDENDIESEHEEQDEAVLEDMRKLQNNRKLAGKFRLINRVGEGTFSTVYKAEDLTYDPTEWMDELFERLSPKKKRRVDSGPKKRYVALKKIYVTSSPSRILNELQILYDLRGYSSVCHIKAAFRLDDQVVAVLPYFPHMDFRLMFRTFLVEDMRHYFKSLLGGLAFVHSRDVIHRDIKPTNFLYNPKLRRGVLVDFGLAEYENEGIGHCLCKEGRASYAPKIAKIMETTQGGPYQGPAGYPRNDSRPSRRANRAGTRGFRAPEVLFKCTNQSTKIDVWSVGVILLTFMGRRFPFFHSLDDADALIEIGCIFGYRRMQRAAAEHGLVFDTNIPSIGEHGFTLAKIVQWSRCVNELTGRDKQAIQLLNHLLDLIPRTRYTAAQALQHSFFQNPQGNDIPWGKNDPAQTAPAVEADDETTCDSADDVKLI